MSNGYIQISIGGRLRGIKFGMLAVEQLLTASAKDKDRNGEINPTKTAYKLIYFGLLNNCEVKNIEPDFDLENVCDWVDDLAASSEGKQILEKVTETFTESRALQIINQKAEEVIEAAKKKKI